MGSFLSWSRRRTLQTSAVPRADYREGRCLLWLELCFFLLRLPDHPRTVQEYVRVGIQGPVYLGFRPADGLSVEFERWDVECRIASMGHSLTRCTPHWRSVRCSVTEVHPCRKD